MTASPQNQKSALVKHCMLQNLPGPVSASSAALTQAKVIQIIDRRGAELESLLKAQDRDGSGTIPVKAFSESLRAFDAASGDAGEEGEEGRLFRADRKFLYREWAVRGYVQYNDFLRASGYYRDPPPRHFDREPDPPPRRDSPRESRQERKDDRRNSKEVVDQEIKEEDTELRERARVVLVHLSEVRNKVCLGSFSAFAAL